MTGDVVAVQGQNVLRGDRMVFNTETGEGQHDGRRPRAAPRTGRAASSIPARRPNDRPTQQGRRSQVAAAQQVTS